jgi:2',3'-cyclic-nucleotide 2'-phosphodiesterase (5'-nucleotidase family)
MAHITLVQLNDLHGYLDPHPELFELTPGATCRSGGGVARIASLLRAIRHETGGEVVALDNGDTFHGSMTTVQTQGAAIVTPMRHLALDGMTAHWEFAYGMRRLTALADSLPYPLLAANVTSRSGSPFPPFTVIDRAGLRIGVIGLAAVLSPHLLPSAEREQVTVTMGDDVLDALITSLRREHGVGLVVVLSHLGFPQDCKLARVASGIDVVLSGHTHHRMRTPAIVNDTLIMQSGAHGSFLGRLDLDVGPDGIADWRHQLLDVDDAIAPDNETQAVIDDVLAPFAAARHAVLGTSRTQLTRYAMLESTLDNLLLDAVAASAGVPLALSNGWRYGAPIPAGPITEWDVWNIVPANPPVSVLTLTGEELHSLYERNLEATFAADPWDQRGGYLKRCRGLQLAAKVENPSGHRIQELRVDGDLVRPGRTYDVAFLGEQAVPQGIGTNRRDTGVMAVDALRNYLTTRREVSAEITGSVTLV